MNILADFEPGLFAFEAQGLSAHQTGTVASEKRERINLKLFVDHKVVSSVTTSKSVQAARLIPDFSSRFLPAGRILDYEFATD